MSRPDVRVRVYARGDRSLDGILRLIELASLDRGQHEVLAAMCAEIAAIAAADVVSVYVREQGPGGDRLVLRGNVGFPASAVGAVSLRVGEGIVGFVAECLRPVLVAAADRDRHYKHVPGLGEERFPVFLGVPLLHGASATGVLVLQRRSDEALADADVVLATAIAAPVAFALQHARARTRRQSAERRGQSATLRGLPRGGGVAMGRASIIPAMSALADGRSDPGAEGRVPGLREAFARVTRDVDRARRRLAGAGDAVTRPLDNLDLVLTDRRFRDQAEAACADSGLAAGLATVARDYARVPYRVRPGDDGISALLAERAREVEDLCLLLYAAATRRALLPQGGIWIAGRFGAFAAICAVARRAAGVVVEAELPPGSPAAMLLAEAKVPAICEVAGLFAWMRPDDLLVLDGDGGSLRINPTSDWVARLRAER